jgi:hypothetical protein
MEEPAPPSLKGVVDTVNSFTWFTMDALWIVGLEWPAYVTAGLTVFTGVWLLALAWRQGWGALFADLGLNCWIWMNTVWLVSDMNGRETPRAFAVSVAILGAAFIAAAAWHSEDLRRLRIYRR